MASSPASRSADELVKRVLEDDAILAELRRDPEKTLRALARDVTTDMPLVGDADPWLYRMIVFIIGLTALIAVVGAVIVASLHGPNAVPDILTALGSGAIGALAGFLTPIQYRR